MENIIEAIRGELDIDVETIDESYTQFSTKKGITCEDIAEIIKESGINFIPSTDEKCGWLHFKDGRNMTITVFDLSGSNNNNWILMSFT